MRTLVIAPHPDDEILGCGGTLLRRKTEGAKLGWLIVTDVSEAYGWSSDMVTSRSKEIAAVANVIGYDHVFNLGYPPAGLDKVAMDNLVGKFSQVFESFSPSEVLLPNRGDVHTDHRITFDAGAACCKWFRCPSVKTVMAYETISETNFALNSQKFFYPNTFFDISDFLEQKLQAMKIYQSELGSFPFPRSVEALRAQAILHGATSGYPAAEAFQLLLQRQ